MLLGLISLSFDVVGEDYSDTGGGKEDFRGSSREDSIWFDFLG